MSNEELQKSVQEYVENFTSLMSVDAEVECLVSNSDDGNQQVISIEYDGQELGYMIGNHGTHLKGLQYVLSLLINRKFVGDGEGRVYVNVDVSGYKQERYGKLEKMAQRMAEEARASGEPIDMEPMGAAERRVVHMELQKVEDIDTESYGEGRDRHVRIIPKGVKKAADMSMFEDDVAVDLLSGDE